MDEQLFDETEPKILELPYVDDPQRQTQLYDPADGALINPFPASLVPLLGTQYLNIRMIIQRSIEVRFVPKGSR